MGRACAVNGRLDPHSSYHIRKVVVGKIVRTVEVLVEETARNRAHPPFLESAHTSSRIIATMDPAVIVTNIKVYEEK